VPIGTHQCPFERYHPRPPTASSSSRLGVRNPTQSFNRCYRNGWNYGLQICPYIHRVYPNKSPFKILEKREREPIQGLPKIFKYPILSQERVKLRNSNFVRIYSQDRSEQKPIKNFGKSIRRRTQELSKFSRAPRTPVQGASHGHLCGSSAFLSTPKRHTLAWDRVVWAIARENLSRGYLYSRRGIGLYK